MAGQQQVAGGGDRDEFRQPFQQAEKNRLDNGFFLHACPHNARMTPDVIFLRESAKPPGRA
jgi:hypothetical protein